MADEFKTSGGPCKNCADRCVNCHATCEKYLSWKADCDKARKDYENALRSERVIDEYNKMKTAKYRRRTMSK